MAGTSKCFQAKPGQLTAEWWHVDAADQTVGHLATELATVLMGKHKPTYTPHVDTGDFIVVTSAEKVHFSGRKRQLKEYTWYTGYTGQRMETAEERLASHPERVIKEAVRRMLPKSKLGRQMLSKLKVYAGTEHPHQAQQPKPFVRSA